ncbi:hypothetical protein [Nocardiopsis dassonvillei]|uniref:hypothetical protein n=1 Tax=Nocardiopsis dassonvillei TaxID=2014 RepID=UPI003624E6E2
MNSSRITEVSATGDVTTVSAHLRTVTLTAGADAATLVVKAGGSGGTTVLTLAATAGTTASSPGLHDALCSGGVHATLTGTAPSATFVYV